MDVLHSGRGSRLGWGRWMVGFVMALVAVAGYYGARSYNPAFSEARRLEVTPGQEMALGLQAAPALAGRFGGLSADQGAQQRVDRVCEDLIGKTSVKDSPYDYDCHVLADEGTAQAFSLPGGQVFITTGLLRRLPGDGPLAGALSREIGHVVARHGVEHLATVRVAGERTGSEVLASYDPEDPASRRDPAVEALIGQVVTMRFSAEDEREADRLAARFLAEAGYDPRALDYSADAASNRSSGFPSARRR